MSSDRSTRIAVAFAREAARSPEAALCVACVDVLAVSGAGITLMGGARAGLVCVSDDDVAALEDLQFTTGEGPCQDAFATGRSVHAPHMDAGAFARWPSFVQLAQASGFGGAFAYPLTSVGANIGVLTLYQHDAGELTDDQQHDSVALAEVLTEAVLSLQGDVPLGMLAPELEDAVAYRAEIHQASGMVAVQLRISAAEALTRIRAHAFVRDQPVGEVAADIVARRLRLDDDRLEPNREAP